jgi:hypothetical protein
MTLRRPDAAGNTRDDKSGSSDPAPRRALLTLRDAVILSGGLVVGTIFAVLTYFAVHNLPEAILSGFPACAGAIAFLDALID